MKRVMTGGGEKILAPCPRPSSRGSTAGSFGAGYEIPWLNHGMTEGACHDGRVRVEELYEKFSGYSAYIGFCFGPSGAIV